MLDENESFEDSEGEVRKLSEDTSITTITITYHSGILCVKIKTHQLHLDILQHIYNILGFVKKERYNEFM